METIKPNSFMTCTSTFLMTVLLSFALHETLFGYLNFDHFNAFCVGIILTVLCLLCKSRLNTPTLYSLLINGVAIIIKAISHFWMEFSQLERIGYAVASFVLIGLMSG